MATRFCPSCGGEFLASVDTCPDCEVDLVDERPAELQGDGDDQPKSGQVEYELHEWAVESRVMLQSLLNAEDIPHAWEGTDLLVPAVVEARVDAMVAQVESTFSSGLDPERPKVAYDIDEWDDELQAALLGLLDEQAIPYELDVDGALVVHEEDEDRVEAAFDEIEQETDTDGGDVDDGPTGDGPSGDASDEPVDDADADADDADDDEELDEDDDEELDEDDLVDLDAQDVMSDLFVAADRLKRKVTDHEGVLTLVERSRDVRRMRLPYGFSRSDWAQIVDATLALNRALEGEDEEIEEHAIALRAVLRPYV